ncbi:MAG: hypothetical protein HPY53_16625 [Brevinematales bacterium]|nr:hypothetical protein [Brevinematales bacterium]
MPKPNFSAFTVTYKGVSRRIIIKDIEISEAYDKDSPPSPLPKSIKVLALWDTGATHSVILPKVVSDLGLTPTGKCTINHGGGKDDDVNTYIVNFVFPNGVTIQGVEVSENTNIVDNFHAIIGMDIITLGDMNLSHVSKNTKMSFRIPTIKGIDYVQEFNVLLFAGTPRNAPCPCGAIDSSGKPLKFKYCHGMNT